MRPASWSPKRASQRWPAWASSRARKRLATWSRRPITNSAMPRLLLPPLEVRAMPASRQAGRLELGGAGAHGLHPAQVRGERGDVVGQVDGEHDLGPGQRGTDVRRAPAGAWSRRASGSAPVPAGGAQVVGLVVGGDHDLDAGVERRAAPATSASNSSRARTTRPGRGCRRPPAPGHGRTVGPAGAGTTDTPALPPTRT